MKRRLETLASLVLFVMIFSLVCSVVSFPSFADSAAPDKAETVELAQELEWVSAEAGWGSVNLNATCSGGAIVVNGKAYDRNCIGSHIPLGDANADIVYDISEYSDDYEWFEVSLAQPDEGDNCVNGIILVDGVEVDNVYWRKSAAGSTEDSHTFSYNPVIMRANIKGASTLTLRLRESGWGQANGSTVWLEPTLYNTDGDKVWASDIVERSANATPTGWDYGYGNVVMLDAKANGNRLNFVGTQQSFEKGLGIQLKGTNYENYAKDKTNTNEYVSVKWDIEGEGFGFFNALVEMDLSYGCYVDVWIDGEEVYHSDLIDSNGTLVFNQIWTAYAPTTVNVPIPENATELEVRFICENGIGDGLINLCNAAFYRPNEYLYTWYAEESYCTAWPFNLTRGYGFNGEALKMHISENDSTEVSENALYVFAGDSENEPGRYEFDISGKDYNFFVSKVGLSHLTQGLEDNSVNSVGRITFYVDVVYENGETKTYSSKEVSWENSGIEFAFPYDSEGAKKLIVYSMGESCANGDGVMADAKLTKAISATYSAGEYSETQIYAEGDKLVKPEDPSVPGYTFKGWRLKGSDEYFNFENVYITEALEFEGVLEANTYNIIYNVKKDGVAEAYDGNYPKTFVFGSEISLPTAEALEGYTFDGWYIGDFRITEFPYTNAGNVTLTASYKTKSYTVTFDVDGGKTEDSVKHGEKAEKPADPTKENYTFKGWFVGDEEYDFNSAVTGDITLTAKFEPKSFSITYKNDKGVGEEASGYDYALKSYTFGKREALPTAEALEGYTFDGWYIAGEKVTEISDAISGDITLVAKYTVKTFKVSFETDGAKTESSVNYNEKVTKPADPTKENYTFKGWFVGDDEYDFNGAVTADVTLTAKFEPKSFSITYKNDKGVGEEASGYDYALKSYTFGKREALPTAEAFEGYTFDGWYIAGEKVTEISADLSGDITLVAKYTVNTFKVSFEIDGAVIFTADVKYGEKITAPDIPGKTGYVFKAWMLGEEEFSFDTAVKSDMTLKASFEKIKKKGCGSSVGGMAIMLITVSLAGASLLTFSKKSHKK